MAKKKRKRPPSGPSAKPQSKPASGDRESRREAARREREERIRKAKRRVRVRRLVRWGIAVLVIGIIAGFLFIRRQADQKAEARVAAAAERIGCGPIEEMPDRTEGMTPEQIHAPEDGEYPAEDSPASSGRHGQALPGDVQVYTQPIPEVQAVHNLEHGYVVAYYRDASAEEGEQADGLPEPVVNELADVVREQDKVILAPYTDLPEDTDLALVSWTRRRTCSDVTNAGDAATVVRAYIEEFRNNPLAPEPNAG